MGSFWTALTRQIRLKSEKSYEVGLVEIFYTPQNLNKIFNSADDRKIKIDAYKYEIKRVEFSKTTNDPIEFMTSFNTKATEENLDVVMLMDFTPTGQLVKFRNKSTHNLELSPNLAFSLGFTKNVFSPGLHTATSVLSTTQFDLLASDQSYHITFTQEFPEQEILISDPEGKDLYDLITKINEKLDDVGVSLSLSAGQLEIESTNSNIVMQMSDRLNYMFGLPAGFFF